jgi:phosphoglycolate phosphatase-like HAD superfamily hydrolase
MRIFFYFIVAALWLPLKAADPLPSWNDTALKHDIIAFVTKITDRKSDAYVPPAKRIAVFDNDGTLWPEKPLYFQLIYALDTVGKMAPEHPEWQRTMPFKAVLDDNLSALLQGDTMHHIVELLAATHTGMSDERFMKEVRNWITTRRHPRFKRPYVELRYRPMRELIRYLERNGFEVYIVSGGGLDFMRAFMPKYFGIASDHIIGSYAKTRFENGEIVKLPEVAFVNDKAGKPVAIYRHIGVRPIFACGNSDGDVAMLQYSARSSHPTFQLLVHHTDAKREYAYDRNSSVGTLDEGLDIAKKARWHVIDMRYDWKRIFAFER